MTTPLAGTCTYNDNMRMKEPNIKCLAMISVLNVFAAAMATGKGAMQHDGLPAASGTYACCSSFAEMTSSRVVAQQRVVVMAKVHEGGRPAGFQEGGCLQAPIWCSTDDGLDRHAAFRELPDFQNAPSEGVMEFFGIFCAYALLEQWSLNLEQDPGNYSERLRCEQYKPTPGPSCRVRNFHLTCTL